jgi:serine/threonine protein kinase/Tfp pilus assembly protein PilF
MDILGLKKMIGKTISHYKILGKLGEGGMGVVYRAHDTKLKRTVALKFLTPQSLGNDEEKARFIQEAQTAAALDHPNICTVYEIDEAEGHTFISMAYIDGQSLKEKIETGPLKIEESLNIAIQVAEGLQEAYEKGIVHRDIKSANIMFTSKGQAKITDFGLAKLSGQTKLTKTGTTVGTAAYMSPEQARGEEVDHRTDIWSLGVVLYEMLTGQLPFKGEYEQAVMYSILNENPLSIRKLSPGFSEEVENILFKLLEKEQENRYQYCKEIKTDLQMIIKKPQPIVKKTKQKKEKFLKRNRKILQFGLPLLTILLILIWYIFIFNQNHQLDSIAILPFQNSSQDPSMEFLSKEIPANIINSLSRLPDLRVVPRTTVFRYADRESDLATIGQDLGVTSVLTGQVNVIGENLIIRAELVNIKNDSQIWGDRFERKITDLLDIEEEITKEISEALQLHLTGEEKAKLIKRYTENIEAYRAYMEGRFWWNKRSQEGFAKANLLFNKAIEIDPDYALAYAGLAEYYCMLSMHLAKPGPFIRQGRIAAEKALSIDETIAEAHTALGYIKFSYDWDWLGAERSFKQAIQLNPRYATAYNWYAALLGIINRHEEAIHYMTQAQEYDPGSAIINRDLGVIYAWAGDFEKAINQLQFTIDMDPDFSPAYFHMAIVYVGLKKYDLAIEYFKKVRAMTGDFFDIIGALGYTYAKSGQKEEALSELKKLEELAKNQDTRASEFCLIHTGLGNNDQAFEWLDIACKNHEFGVVVFGPESELWFEDLLPDPRFKEFLTRIGIEK